jgi:hypothetical protein
MIVNKLALLNMNFSFLCLLLLFGVASSRPAMQRIEINNHVWEVPNEPGWEEVVKEIEVLQKRLLSSCKTVAECYRIIDDIRAAFFRYPVSEKYLAENSDDGDDLFTSIFKWG